MNERQVRIAEDGQLQRLVAQHHMTAAIEAIRTTFLANGGALLAAMTLVGTFVSEDRELPGPYVAAAFGCFALGISFSIVVAIWMWSLQDDTENQLYRMRHRSGKQPQNRRAHGWLQICLGISVAFFVGGMAMSGILVMELPPRQTEASTTTAMAVAVTRAKP